MNWMLTEKTKRVEDTIRHILRETEDKQKVFTPFPLCEEVVDKIPSLDGNILVVCNVEFVYTLYSKGVDMDRVYFATPCPLKAMVVGIMGIPNQNVFRYKNLITKEGVKGMKFDVVIGNPPYQSEQHNLRDRLWMQFVDQSFGVIDSFGYLAFITPTNWSFNDQLYSKWFTANTPIYINIDECEKHFPGVGSTFSWYVIQKQPNKESNKVVIQTKTDLSETTLPRAAFGSHPLAGQIIDKLTSSDHPRMIAYARSSHHTSKNYGKYSKDESQDFPIKVIKSLNATTFNYGWGKNVDPDMEGPRVIGFNMVPGWLSGTMFHVVDGAQTTESILHMPAPTMQQAHILKKVLQSKLFLFAVKTLNSNRTVRAQSLRALPTVNLNHSWTDQELYEHFNLTQEEINLIEETIK